MAWRARCAALFSGCHSVHWRMCMQHITDQAIGWAVHIVACSPCIVIKQPGFKSMGGSLLWCSKAPATYWHSGNAASEGNTNTTCVEI